VRDLLVREGAQVTADEVLIRLDDTQARANLGIIDLFHNEKWRPPRAGGQEPRLREPGIARQRRTSGTFKRLK